MRREFSNEIQFSDKVLSVLHSQPDSIIEKAYTKVTHDFSIDTIGEKFIIFMSKNNVKKHQKNSEKNKI